jgi:uncharacterized coiled-coil protein SlyX
MDERQQALEIKVSYLEKQVDELDAVVRQVTAEMQLLRNEVARLRQLTEPESEHLPHEKPPHY